MADAKERPHDRFAVQPWQPPASVLVPDKAVSTWFDRFSADDEELYTNTVSNAEGLVVLDEGKTEKKTWR